MTFKTNYQKGAKQREAKYTADEKRMKVQKSADGKKSATLQKKR